MKQILIFISLFFITICTINAQSVTANQVNGRLQMTTVSNVSDSTWSITGYFTNSVNKYLPSNINVNDKFFCQIGANTYVGRISVINSRSDVTKLMTFRVICNYPNPPNNIGAIIRATSNGYPVFVDGLPNALQAGIQNYFATLINTNAAGNPCEKTITKTNHGFRKGTPVKRVGGTYVRPTNDNDIPDYVVVDSLTANTFKVSTCGIYTSTLPDGLYWYTSAAPGYSLTQDTVKVPLFQVIDSTLILDPIVGFNLMSDSGIGLVDGDKGDITVTDSGVTWTIDNDAITASKIGAGQVGASEIASKIIDSTKVKDRSLELLQLAGGGASSGQVPTWNATSNKYEPQTPESVDTSQFQNAVPYVDASTALTAWGDSYTAGSNASTTAARFPNIIQDSLDKASLVNEGHSAKGINQSISRSYALDINQTITQARRNAATLLVGLNDVLKTKNFNLSKTTYTDAFKTFFADHFISNLIYNNNSTVTKTAGWANIPSPTTFISKSYLSSGSPQAIYSNSTTDSIVINNFLVKRQLVVGYIGSSPAITQYGTMNVYVDNVLVGTITQSNKLDSTTTTTITNPVITSPTNNQGSRVAIFDVSPGLKKIKLVPSANGTYCTFDFLSTLEYPINTYPLVVGKVPKIPNSGYAAFSTPPKSGAEIDTINAKITTAVNYFQQLGFPIRLMNTEYYLNTTTHMSGDSVHPNDAGHLALANMFVLGFKGTGGALDTKIFDIRGTAGDLPVFNGPRTLGGSGIRSVGGRLLVGGAVDDGATPAILKGYGTSSTQKTLRILDAANSETAIFYANGDMKIKDSGKLYIYGTTFYITAATGLELRSPNLVNIVANGVSSTRIDDIGIAVGVNPARDEFSILHLNSGTKVVNMPRVATATTLSSKVKEVTVTAGGSGYTSAPTVSFSGGGGTGAAATASISANQVVSITVTNGGSGYTSPPTISFSGGGGTGAAAFSGLLLEGSEFYGLTNYQKEIYAKGAYRGMTMNYDRTLTSGLWLKGGTTGERPTVTSGDYVLRYNSTIGTPEILTSSTSYSLFQGLSGSATLDFPNTTTATSSDLTITVTGAADGDVVSLGVVNALRTVAGTDYRAWVSSANTVTVRFLNTSGSDIDPASNTFKVTVIK